MESWIVWINFVKYLFYILNSQDPSPQTFKKAEVLTLPIKRQYERMDLHPQVKVNPAFNKASEQ